MPVDRHLIPATHTAPSAPTLSARRASLFLNLLILFCAPSLLPALPFVPAPGLPGDREPGQLQLVTTNDLLGAEFAVNQDDYRSYGFGATLGLGHSLALDTRMYFFTNRDYDFPEDSLRSDALSLEVSWLYRFDNSLGSIHLEPSLGFSVDGDLGGKALQDAVHNLFDFPLSQATYAKGSCDGPFCFSSLVSLASRYAYPIPLADGLYLVPTLSLEARAQGLSSQALALAGILSLEDRGNHRFDIHAGWSTGWGTRANTCVDVSVAKERDFFYGLNLRMGALSWQAVSWPQQGFANGAVSLYLSTGTLKNTRTGLGTLRHWQVADVDTTWSLGLFNWERQVRAGFAALGFKRGSIAIRPSFDYSYGDAVPAPANPDIIYRFMQVAPGLEVLWTPLPIALEFIVGLDAGLRVEQHWTLNGITPVPGPVVQVQAGLRTRPIALLPASGLFSPTDRYGLSLAGSLQYQGLPGMAQALTGRISLGLVISSDWAN